MIAFPPSLVGAEKLIVSVPLALGVILVIVGALGVVKGVADIELLASPEPCVLTARIITEYSVPFVSSEITSGDVVAAGLRDVHVVPPSSEYW